MTATTAATSDRDQLAELGPIDYIVLEWHGREPSGEAAPLLGALVGAGIIRILDIALMAKAEDGSVAALDLGGFGDDTGFGELVGASSGLISQDDLEQAAVALKPGAYAAVLIWENRWAAPVAAAMRRSGGELVASGRIPTQAIVAALDALEAADATTGNEG